jgi:hypothetical protein
MGGDPITGFFFLHLIWPRIYYALQNKTINNATKEREREDQIIIKIKLYLFCFVKNFKNSNFISDLTPQSLNWNLEKPRIFFCFLLLWFGSSFIKKWIRRMSRRLRAIWFDDSALKAILNCQQKMDPSRLIYPPEISPGRVSSPEPHLLPLQEITIT